MTSLMKTSFWTPKSYGAYPRLMCIWVFTMGNCRAYIRLTPESQLSLAWHAMRCEPNRQCHKQCADNTGLLQMVSGASALHLRFVQCHMVELVLF